MNYLLLSNYIFLTLFMNSFICSNPHVPLALVFFIPDREIVPLESLLNLLIP